MIEKIPIRELGRTLLQSSLFERNQSNILFYERVLNEQNTHNSHTLPEVLIQIKKSLVLSKASLIEDIGVKRRSMEPGLYCRANRKKNYQRDKKRK